MRTFVADRTTVEGETLIVVPSLGQLGPAHLLLIPMRHITGLSALSEDEVLEAQAVIEHLCDRLAPLGHEVIMFEHGHGSGAGLTDGCGIGHAHLHLAVVDTATVLPTPPSPNGQPWQRMSVVGSHWLTGLPTDTNYLFFATRSNDVPLLLEAEHVPSQFLRRWLAELLHEPQWDWRADSDLAAFRRRVAFLRERIGSLSALPCRAEHRAVAWGHELVSGRM
jgi:diadenosine tetraphosphate (Ap4A) HIT family hydrolase